MKRIIIAVLACVWAISAFAQTNFRNLTFDQALEAAAKENKLIFIDFYTTWCRPCKQMAEVVFPNPEVGRFMNSKFVAVKYDAEKEGKALAARFKVTAYPTFLILNAKGEVQFDIKGSMPPDAFIAKLDSSIDPEWSATAMAERYQSGERTPELINRYALHIMQQNKEAEGFEIIDGYFNSLDEAAKLREENVFLYTRYTIDWNNAKAKFMVANKDRFPSSVKHLVDERIEKLYHALVASYFSGYMWKEGKFSAEEFAKVKEDVKYLNSSRVKFYSPMFRMIESRVADSDEEFWKKCKTEYELLDDSDKELFIMNISRLLETDDAEMLGDIVAFIRESLPSLRPSTIMLCGRLLDDMESRLEKQ